MSINDQIRKQQQDPNSRIKQNDNIDTTNLYISNLPKSFTEDVSFFNNESHCIICVRITVNCTMCNVQHIWYKVLLMVCTLFKNHVSIVGIL